MTQANKRKTGSAQRVALVTGGSSGIGKAIVFELGRNGYKVYSAARSLADCFDEPENIKSNPEPWLRTVRLDVHFPAQGLKTVDRIVSAEGRLDVLVQAAGFGIAGAVEDTVHEEARSQMETNFFGSISLLPPVLAQMRSQKSGLIVNIGSVAGFLPIPFQAYYSASKAAMSSLTMALADEVRPFGIRCMIVQPGDTQTGFTQARILSRQASQSDYAVRCKRSVLRMENDEKNGMSPDEAARIIVRGMMRKRPPIILTVGLLYKLYALACRILPVRLVRRVVYWLYGS